MFQSLYSVCDSILLIDLICYVRLFEIIINVFDIITFQSDILLPFFRILR